MKIANLNWLSIFGEHFLNFLEIDPLKMIWTRSILTQKFSKLPLDKSFCFIHIDPFTKFSHAFLSIDKLMLIFYVVFFSIIFVEHAFSSDFLSVILLLIIEIIKILLLSYLLSFIQLFFSFAAGLRIEVVSLQISAFCFIVI